MTTLVLRGMIERRLRSALTAVAILLGVAMVAGTFVQTDQITRAFEDIQHTANSGTDVVVRPKQQFGNTTFATNKPISQDLVAKVAAVPGVATAKGGLDARGALVVNGKRIVNQFAPSLVVSTSGPPFDPTQAVEGRQPAADGEIAVIAETAREEHLRVGQRVGLSTGTGVKDVTIVGIFTFGDVASIGGASVVSATLSQLQEWFDRPGQITSVMAAADAGVSPTELADRVAAVTGPDLEVKTGEAEAQSQADDINASIGGFLTPMLLVLSGAALLVGAFIIFNTFSITVAQRTREFALLRALGATRAQIVRAVGLEALALGVGASLVGLLGGLGFARLLGILFDAVGAGIPRADAALAPRTIIVSLVVGVGVTLAAALAPALRATRVAPVQALTGTAALSPRARRWAPWIAGLVSVLGLAALIQGLFGAGPASARIGVIAAGAILIFVGISLVARHIVKPLASAAGWFIERAFRTPGRLARENAMRNPGRTATTSSALMVGLALVVFVCVFTAGLKESITNSSDQLLTSDIILTSEGSEPLPKAAGVAIARVPSVDAVAPLYLDQVQVNGEPSDLSTDVINGVAPDQLQAVYSFEWLRGGTDAAAARLSGNGALVEEQFAKSHEVSVGDVFTIQTSTGPRVRLQAQGVYRDPLVLPGVVVAQPAFERASAATDPLAVLITSADGADAAAVKRDVSRALAAFPVAKVQTTDEYRDASAAQLDQFVYLLYALLALILVISLFGIANSLFLSIHERTREFGMLRAIGATRTQVRRIVRYESVITAAIGGLLGTGIGLLFAFLITTALSDLGLGFSVPVGQLAGFLVLAVLVGVVAAVVPARRGASIDVLEAMHHE
jgi:putative ABC transport system permease protein